jgi:hypothetical protein
MTRIFHLQRLWSMGSGLALALCLGGASGCGAPDGVSADESAPAVAESELESAARAQVHCPAAIIHNGKVNPGDVANPAQGADCDAISHDFGDTRGGAVVCDGQKRRFICVDNSVTSHNPNDHAGHFELCQGRFAACNTCKLKLGTESPPPFFHPYGDGRCIN